MSHTVTKLALKPLRTNLFNIVLSVIFLTVGLTTSHAQDGRKRGRTIPPAEQKKTTTAPEKKADTLTIDKKTTEKATQKNDSIKKEKKGLNAVVTRSAKDYEKIDQRKKELTLYNEAYIKMEDMELNAGIIVMKYDKDEVFAGRMKDSTGKYTQYPHFKQGSNEVEADSIHFNTKTKKARVWNSRTDQGEFRVKADITKKENDSVYFMRGARFTTSKNIDNPEYFFFTNKIKMVPGQKVVVGPTNMWIADVPTPLGLPFAFFPMSNKAESGFIIPSYGDSNTRGYYLQNMGYYFTMGEYVDLAVTGDYYTNGSYGLRGQSSYAKRYKYNGSVNLRFENLITSERGFPDYSRTKNYNIQWSHSQDAKSNPNSRFSASVNMGSSQYYRQSLNTANIGASLNNILQSSVSYAKTFQTVPQVNLSLSATHSQNTNTKAINMTLPTLQASVDRIFPFARQDEPKKGLIKNFNLQYNLRGENRISTYDSLFFKPEMFRDAKTGFQHTIPLSTNFKVARFFSVTAGSNYQESWVMNTVKKSYNTSDAKVVTTDVKGFDAFRTYNFNSSVGTTLYGMFNFGEDKKIQAIRHVVRPSLTYTYTPSFSRYFQSYQMNAAGTKYGQYTRFENSMFGAPSNSLSNTLGIDINNTFEAKVRNNDEKATEPKKVMLLNNLQLHTSYDIAADSLKWSALRISAGTNLFKNKMNVNFGATLDPYALGANGRTINTFNIDNGGSLFRLTGGTLTMNYSFSSNELKGDNKDDQTAKNGGRTDDLFGTATSMTDQRKSMFGDEDETKKKKPGGKKFYELELPWDLKLAYSLTYMNDNRQKKITNNSIMLSGNVDVNQRWKMGFSSGFDFVNKGITFTQLRFERDLLSWRMDFNWVPMGTSRYWTFFIGIKSSVLSDIKWDKRQVPDRRIQ